MISNSSLRGCFTNNTTTARPEALNHTGSNLHPMIRQRFENIMLDFVVMEVPTRELGTNWPALRGFIMLSLMPLKASCLGFTARTRPELSSSVTETSSFSREQSTCLIKLVQHRSVIVISYCYEICSGLGRPSAPVAIHQKWITS